MEVLLRPTFYVSCSEIEKLILETWGYGFSVSQATGQRARIEIRVTGLFMIPTWKDRADLVRSGRRSRDLCLILNVLCADGAIPAGSYVVCETLPVVSGAKWKNSLKVVGVLC